MDAKPSRPQRSLLVSLLLLACRFEPDDCYSEEKGDCESHAWGGGECRWVTRFECAEGGGSEFAQNEGEMCIPVDNGSNGCFGGFDCVEGETLIAWTRVDGSGEIVTGLGCGPRPWGSEWAACEGADCPCVCDGGG